MQWEARGVLGNFIIYSAGFAFLLIGIAMIVRAAYRGSGAREALGGFLLIAAVVGLDIWNENSVDLNPVVTRPEIVGIWSDGDTHILFRNDGTAHLALDSGYARVLGNPPPEVTWGWNGDFNIALTVLGAKEQPPELRVIRYIGRLRIIVEMGADPDDWNTASRLAKDS
jgi:hypothetical protein